MFYCKTLLNNCVSKTQTFQTFTLPYMTLLVYLGLWFWIKTPKPKKVGAVSLPTYDHQKLQRLYSQGGGAYESVQNLVKTINQPASKVRQFLHSKPSHTNFTLATRKFKDCRHLLEEKTKLGVWIWLKLTNWLKIKECNVNTSSSWFVWYNRRCKRNENKGFQRNCSSILKHDYKK